ncbi:MAG: flagellar basal body rod protein FlgF [Gammaproteobacteria bacterium]|nr:flagellar basal body rod protein FlgF [Gammaproteobacteria bacterium]
MDRILYISKVALGNVERAQAAHANNLANVSTVGFRADLARVLGTDVDGTVQQSGAAKVSHTEGVDMSHGTQMLTDRSLDFAINGDGLLAVLLSDGSEGFTRNGSLQIDASGQLLSYDGHLVLGQGGPIAVPPGENLLIGSDGTLTIQPEGQGPESLVTLDRLKLVNPPASEIARHPTGYLARVDREVSVADINVRVTSGFLESSNVSAINELTRMLALSRQFELEVRMMRVADENDQAASQLLRIG